ncbi:MAG: hypothetical protein ACI9WS_001840 [Paraglaciecola psychrophila]
MCYYWPLKNNAHSLPLLAAVVVEISKGVTLQATLSDNDTLFGHLGSPYASEIAAALRYLRITGL